MTTQNFVSAAFSAEAQKLVIQHLTEARKQMDFLITLTPDQVKTMHTAANTMIPFMDQVHASATAHPEVVLSYTSIPELTRDMELAEALDPIDIILKEFSQAVHDTKMAARSDAFSQCLEIYASIKMFAFKIPGLKVVADSLAQFFPRTRQPKEEV